MGNQVWSRLGRAQMQAMNIKGAVESFCKAKDAQDYTNMVSQASAAEAWEELVTSPNVAQIQVVGDKCFDAALYEAAKLLFLNISNYGRLASARVMLGEFQAAVDAAKKAMSP